MRRAILVALAVSGCQHEGVRTQTFELPLAEPRTIFSVVDLGEQVQDEDRYGRVGDTERLGGPALEIEAERVFVAQFAPTDFNGVRGPELVYMREEARDGLDAVRLPSPASVYEVVDGVLVLSDADLGDLRVPCDGARAATRPSVEVDTKPRCPLGGTPVVVTCDDLTRSLGTRRTFLFGDEEVEVVLEQNGCRVDFTCRSEGACPAMSPSYAILPPHGAAKADDALLELLGGDFSCPRVAGDAPTFACPDGAVTLMR